MLSSLAEMREFKRLHNNEYHEVIQELTALEEPKSSQRWMVEWQTVSLPKVPTKTSRGRQSAFSSSPPSQHWLERPPERATERPSNADARASEIGAVLYGQLSFSVML